MPTTNTNIRTDGTRYEIERYSLKETANIVRRCLKEAFPGVKFSVRSQSYSMGSSIRVRWTDGPMQQAVNDLIKRFQYAGAMRIDDYVPSLRHEVDGKEVSFGAKHIFCERDVSPVVLEAVDTLSDDDLITLAFKLDAIRGYDIRDGKPDCRRELAARLARYVPIWTGEQQPCPFAESVAITGEY